MPRDSAPEAHNYKTVRLGPGRHDGPGGVVCVMELASMLAGERFTDRPASVCPLVGAVVRAYNDAVDDARRQDLYRFAAEAVGTRGGFDLQRRRAEVALNYVRARAVPPPARQPELDAGPEEIADHVVWSMARRPKARSPKRRWDDVTHAQMIELLDRLIATGAPVGQAALLGEFVEHPAEPVEHGGGEPELLVAELGQRGPEAWLDLSAPGLDEGMPPVGEAGEDHAMVAVGAGALDEACLGQTGEHLGDAGGAQVGGVRELAGGAPAPNVATAPVAAAPAPAPALDLERRTLALPVEQREEQAVLSVGEATRPAQLPAAHAPKRGQRRFERPAEVLGGIVVMALVCHAGRRLAERGA